jgi:hypothetical protein
VSQLDHSAVLDNLLLLEAKALPPPVEAEVLAHLGTCPACKAERDHLRALNVALTPDEIASALDVGVPPHASDSHLRALLDGSSIGGTGATPLLDHVLDCGLCYQRFADMAAGVTVPIEVPDPSVTADAIWDALQMQRLVLALSWTGLVLGVAVRSRRVGTGGRARGSELSQVSEGPSGWRIQRQFGSITAVIEISASAGGPKSFDLRARLIGAPDQNINVELLRGGEVVAKAAIRQSGEFAVEALSPGAYTLLLLDGITGEQVAVIDIADE